ncbi:peptidoglycan DD-metalloendopeptidase family protein [Paenibacillus solisilvae]|uniref:Peptidoglycan DD-metalloendopeptidase family protein n=1 Tax=Paenibacillus solisilvae TaxID=2486751 RepID=A0ABW0VPC4_9BACL
MNDQNKPKLDTPKNTMGGTAVKPSAWRKLLSKKWAAPAAFMAAAAIIVTLMWLYQGADETSTKPANTESEVSQGTTDATAEATPPDDEAVAVISSNETIQWPADRTQLEVVSSYYDANGTNEERQAGLIQDGNKFYANQGIDLAKADDKPFDVTAALSGIVSLAGTHPLNGSYIEIKHSDGIVTVYQSLSGVKVKVGDEVKQGTIIAQAGRSELGKDLGVHLHFEVRKDGKPMNPSTLIEQ